MMMKIAEQQNELSAPDTVESPSPYLAIGGLSLSVLLPSLGTSVANVALPTFAREFQAPLQSVQWVVLSYLLVTSTAIVPMGRLGDLAGRRRLLLAGISLFTAASVLCAVAPSLWVLIAARALQGIGGAAMMALTMAFVGDTVPTEKSGTAMGMLGAMSAVGTALGPTLGGLLITGFGWPAIFLVNVPLGLAAYMLSHRVLPIGRPTSRAERPRFDHVGTGLLAVALVSYSLAMTLGRGSFVLVNAVLLAAAALATVIFIAAEKRAKSPLIDLRMLRNGVLGSAFATSGLVTAVVMASLVVGPFYLSGALQLDTVEIGLVMSCGPIVAALAGLPAGKLVDRFGARRMTLSGLVIMASGCLMLAALPTAFGVPGYIAPLAAVTAGYSLFQTANNTAVMAGASSKQRGVVSGILTMSRNLGLVTGASVMPAIFAATSGTTIAAEILPNAASTGMKVAFAFAALLIVIAIAISARARAFSIRAS